MRLRWWVLLSLVVAAGCAAALYYIVNTLWPVSGTVFARPQLLFLTFMFLGLSAGFVPITAYLNHRFAGADWSKRDRLRLPRQGAWVGLLGVVLAYLQLIRALNITIALVLAGVFIFIEMFFLTRE